MGKFIPKAATHATRLPVYIGFDLHCRIKEAAASFGCTLTDFTAQALAYALDQMGDAPSEPPKFVPAFGRKPKDTTEEDRAVRAFYETGATLLDCSKKFERSTATVADMIRRAGGKTRPKGIGPGLSLVNQDRAQKIEAWLEEGLDMQEIGSRLNITRERVRQICVKAGISTEHRLTEAQKAAVQDYIDHPEHALEFVANKHKVHQQTLKRWIVKAGHQPRPSPRLNRKHPETIARAKKVAALYEAGWLVKDIAVAVGYKKPEQVYRDLNIMGVERQRQPRGIVRSQPELMEKIVTDYRDNGLKVPTIARRYAISDRTVYRALHGAGIKPERRRQPSNRKPRKPPNPTDWTLENIKTLERLWEEGLTASEIAERMGGISRNAVLGKAHRLGLPQREPLFPDSAVNCTETVS